VDAAFLGTASSMLLGIDEWKYSTGAIFDHPPYDNEMAGFDPGKLLNKQYASPMEARLKGAYSSGFINGRHHCTVHPSKIENLPLTVSRFRVEGEIQFRDHIKFYAHSQFKSNKAPSLISLAIFYNFEEGTSAEITIGDADAFSITLYSYNKEKMIVAASTVTARFDFQAEYEMHYDSAKSLEAITSGDLLVWKRKSSK
jgi:hypothetical protein